MDDFPVRATIKALGGASKTARAINEMAGGDVVAVLTAHNWFREGKLPKWRLPVIRQLAEQRGLDLDELRAKESEVAAERAKRIKQLKARRARRARKVAA